MFILTSLLRRAERRRVYTDLMQMDDYLLRDIGVSRRDLREISLGTRTTRAAGKRTSG
jgi:uncharacterized protein YjiS (DUF1127 family)